MGHGAASGVKPVVEQRQGGRDDGQDRIVESGWQRFMLHTRRSGAGTTSSCRLASAQCAAALRIWSEGRAASQRRTGSRRQHRGDFGRWPSTSCAAWLRAGLRGTIHGSARSSCIGARPVRAHEPASAVSRCPALLPLADFCMIAFAVVGKRRGLHISVSLLRSASSGWRLFCPLHIAWARQKGCL